MNTETLENVVGPIGLVTETAYDVLHHFHPITTRMCTAWGKPRTPTDKTFDRLPGTTGQWWWPRASTLNTRVHSVFPVSSYLVPWRRLTLVLVGSARLTAASPRNYIRAFND